MIREIRLAAAGWDEDQIAEPPTGELSVSVIGDHAWLAWHHIEASGARVVDPALSLQVSAQSLLLALHAAWDDNHPRPASPTKSKTPNFGLKDRSHPPLRPSYRR